MKVAVASSGLGHVARGIETWALDTARALAEKGMQVTLFAGGEEVSGKREAGSRRPKAGDPDECRDGKRGDPGVRPVVLPCFQRGKRAAQRLARMMPGGMWRWGLKSAYGWEQFSFWWHLWPRLRRGQFDILHVQDPMLAYWCRRFRASGLVKTREILAHGTEEPPAFLRQFEYIQHLALWHLQQALAAASGSHPNWVAIPNFVDTNVFHPAGSKEEKEGARRELGIPSDAFVVGTAAAVKTRHKRIDYLVREFARVSSVEGRVSRGDGDAPAFLVIAGAGTEESEKLQQMAEELAPGRIKFFLDHPREHMPAFYRALDVFVLVSLFEMMPIAVLEALASGLPVIANRHPVLEWMVGASGKREAESGTDRGAESRGGDCIDMAEEGALAGFLAGVSPEWIQQRSDGARRRAENMFSKQAVAGEYIAYYEKIAGDE